MSPDAIPPSRPGKIVCVGRNYLDHATELGHVAPESPLLFLKPPSSVIGNGETILLPPESQRVDHEAEIGVVIGAYLRNIDPQTALDGVAGITCVNDVTARDLQKSDGQWTRAKGFDTFCPIGPRVVPLDELAPLDEIEVIGRVNGVERQRGRAGDMVFDIAFLIADVSRIMTLEPGDLLSTGTPAGVGPLQPDDTVEVEIPGVGVLRNPVARR